MIKMKLTNRPTVYICLLGIFLLLITFNRRPIVVEKTEPVIVWQDKALGDAVKYNMWRSEEDEVSISRAKKFDSGRSSDSTGLPAMLLEGKDIKRLDDLQYFTSLGNLIIRNTSVTDFSPLEKMTNLRRLSIEGGEATNIESLGRLEKLTILKLSNMPDAIIPSLENLKELFSLSLNGMSLDNLAAIGDLERVSGLYIENTNIRDVSALSNFSSLGYLVLDNCPIETLPKLPGSLDILELRRTSVKDLSILPRGIGVVRIKNNDIDFQSLDGLKNLYRLEIYNADLGNIDEIICLPELMSLTLMNCQLERFDFVEGNNLGVLNLSRNKIKKIDDIKNLKNFISLNLSYNELVDLDGIERALNLVSLDLTGNRITNIGSLKGLGNLTEVDLSGNPILTGGTEMKLQEDNWWINKDAKRLFHNY